jgi:hypothetical protein
VHCSGSRFEIVIVTRIVLGIALGGGLSPRLMAGDFPDLGLGVRRLHVVTCGELAQLSPGRAAEMLNLPCEADPQRHIYHF